MYVICLYNIKCSTIVQSLILHTRVQVWSFTFFTNVDVQVLLLILQNDIKHNYQTDTLKHSGYYLNTGMRSTISRLITVYTFAQLCCYFSVNCSYAFIFDHFQFFKCPRSCRSPWRQPGGENLNSPRTFARSCDRHPGWHARAHKSAANTSLQQHPGPWVSRTDPVSISLNILIILNTYAV